MWTDVIDLRDFYETALGRVARRMILRRVREIWPDVHDQRLLGLGYATPYLRTFMDEAERVLAIMPASLGVMAWPSDERGLVALAEEQSLPLPDRSVDRVLLLHGLESTDNDRSLMRELWRVLADGGRLLTVAANRSSLWARLDTTPFGQGRPYTAAQLNELLRDTLFMPLQTRMALYIPPFSSRLLLRSAPVWDRVGSRLFPNFAGVLMVEAAKQLYAASTPRKLPSKRRAYVALPGGYRYQPPGRD